MNTLAFSKMQGAGNDFMVVDATENKFVPSVAQLQQWSDRNFGVGFDQFLLVEKSDRVDFKYRIFNADGSEVEQCGNGARCFAKFVHEQGLTNKTSIAVETMNADIILSVLDNGEVTVDMGAPRFAPQDIPLSIAAQANHYTVSLEQEEIVFSAVSMGNPHAVVEVHQVDSYPVAAIGAALENHRLFPEHVNVGFMEVEARNTIKLRVFERGSGETLACGSGACAAVVCGIRNNLLDSPVLVKVRGGTLRITWDLPEQNVMMTGAAQTVYQGQIGLVEQE